MIKGLCATFAHWRARRHLVWSRWWADVEEWLITRLSWRSIRARRAKPPKRDSDYLTEWRSNRRT